MTTRNWAIIAVLAVLHAADMAPQTHFAQAFRPCLFIAPARTATSFPRSQLVAQQVNNGVLYFLDHVEDIYTMVLSVLVLM